MSDNIETGSCGYANDGWKDFVCHQIRGLRALKEQAGPGLSASDLKELVCNALITDNQRREDCAAFRSLKAFKGKSDFAKPKL